MYACVSSKCTEIFCSYGFVPDLTGEVYSTPQPSYLFLRGSQFAPKYKRRSGAYRVYGSDTIIILVKLIYRYYVLKRLYNIWSNTDVYFQLKSKTRA